MTTQKVEREITRKLKAQTNNSASWRDTGPSKPRREGGETMTLPEITFRDFSTLARKRGHNAESLAELFRGKIEEPRELFERVMSCRWKGEDRSDVMIPYRSVIAFYQAELHYFADVNARHRQCACGCGRPVFDRQKWATAACKKKVQRETA
jgi:hypothetical protein